MFDCEGRQTTARVGVKRVDAADKGKLKFSEFGLAPHTGHTGVMKKENAGLKHFEVQYSATSVPKGKKHIDMVHQQPLEIQKRIAGKIGLKKLKAPTHPEPQPRNKPSINSQTCEQRAKARLEKALHEDPSVAKFAGPALEAGNTHALLDAEKKLYRQLAINKAKDWQAQAGEKKVINRAPPSAKSAVSTPFATENANASPTQHHHRKPVPAPYRPEPRHEGVAVSAQRSRQDQTPFDTKYSCKDYPDPPVIGTSKSTANVKRGKQFAEPTIDRRDNDQVAAQRAQNRRPHTAGGAGGMPDFLYGNVPPPQSKRIRAAPGSSGMPCGDPPVRNRAIDPSKMKTTHLW